MPAEREIRSECHTGAAMFEKEKGRRNAAVKIEPITAGRCGRAAAESSQSEDGKFEEPKDDFVVVFFSTMGDP